MTVTIYDVAREANVSMATVSRVVNGNQNVKPATRKKVLEVIERLEYRPNAVARGLASKKTTSVGVIIPDISNNLNAELARGIEDIATMYRYNIILANSDQNEEKELSLLDTMLGKQVDGIVMICLISVYWNMWDWLAVRMMQLMRLKRYVILNHQQMADAVLSENSVIIFLICKVLKKFKQLLKVKFCRGYKQKNETNFTSIILS